MDDQASWRWVAGADASQERAAAAVCEEEASQHCRKPLSDRLRHWWCLSRNVARNGTIKLTGNGLQGQMHA